MHITNKYREPAPDQYDSANTVNARKPPMLTAVLLLNGKYGLTLSKKWS